MQDPLAYKARWHARPAGTQGPVARKTRWRAEPGGVQGPVTRKTQWRTRPADVSLAVMYRDQGIHANAIAPGGTATSIRVGARPGAHGPSVIGAHAANVGRVATAEEQAAAIVFLASEAAGNVNGVILPVDNGWSAI